MAEQLKRRKSIQAIFFTKHEPSYFGPLLKRKDWQELYSLLEAILTDAIMEPPGRAYIIENVAKIIKILSLEDL